MKRICSLLLSLLLFLDALPWQSLALARAEDETAADGISSDDLSRALALTGLQDVNPEWDDDISLNNMNAAQMLAFLQDAWDDEFEGVMDTFQDMYTFLETANTSNFSPVETAELATFYSAYYAAQDLQDEILYYMDILEDSSHRIVSLNDRISRMDPRAPQEELFATSALEDLLYGEEIEAEYAALNEAMNQVKLKFNDWNAQWDNYALMLCGEEYNYNTPAGLQGQEFDSLADRLDKATSSPPPDDNPVMYGKTAPEDGSPILLSREVSLPPASSPSCLDRLSPIRSALADSKQSVGVTVLDDKAFIIRVREGKNDLSGVIVKASDVDKKGNKKSNKTEKTGKSDNKGMTKYMVRDFSPDGNGAMWVSLELSKPGYRKLCIPCVSIGKGTVFNVSMQKDDNTPYVMEATLDGRDMLANSCELLVSEKIIESRTMHFAIAAKGKPYTFKLYYTKDNKETVLLEESGPGQTVNEPSHELKDKQLSKLLPGGAKLFVEIKCDGHVYVTPLKLTVTMAVVDQPMTLPGVANIFNRNLVFGLPSSWPGPLGKTKIQIDIPVVKMWPVNAMILPNGMGFIMIGIKHSKPIDKKNADAQALAAGVKAVEQEGWRRVQEFKSGGAKDYNMPLWKLGSFGLEVGLMFCGVGQLADAGGDSLRALRLRASIGGTAKASGEYQFNVYGIINFGVTGYLNSTLTIGLGVNIFFARKQGSFSYHSWEFSPANSGWTLNMRLEIGVFVGLGYKGVCGANVTGYGFLELAVRGTPKRGGTTGVAVRGTNAYDMSYELIGGFGARLTLQFFFIKAIYQLGDEIKWQLLPTFKRLSSRDSMLERFISAVRPPVAAADTPSKATDPALSNVQQLNSRLLLSSKKIDDVRDIQNAYADNIQFATLKDQYNNKEDYAFYLKKHVNSSNKVEDYVDLYSMTTSKGSQTSIRDTLHRFVEDGDAGNSMYKIKNRIVAGYGVKKELLEGDIWKYDVVGYSISPISNYTSFKADLVAVCMLLAKDYQEVTVGDGDKTRKVKLPKETYCMLATMVPLAGARLEPMMYVIPGYYQFCCVFKVDSKVPVCNPQVDGQLFTHVVKVGSTWKNTPHQGDRFIINIIFPTVNPAKHGDVCCYRIEAPMMDELTDSKRESKSNIGWFFQKSTGLECSSNLREYTLRNIQAGNQTMVPTKDPQYRFQGHWYAIASPKDKPNARQLVMSNGNGQNGVILEDSGEVVDYLIYHKTWVNPANNIKMPGENCPNNKEYLLMLVKDPKSGKTCIKSVEVTLERNEKVLTFKQAEVKNFAVPASTNKLNVLRRVVGNTDLVWWMEASSPEKNQSKNALWLVKGCWMSASDNLLTQPFVLAAISEPNAAANKVGGMPAFHIFSNSRSTDPFKEVLSGIYLIKKSANDKQEVEGKVKDVTLNYKRFKFNLVPELDIAGAAMTRDIVAPGSYDDLEFTVHNNGNMPIDSFTVGIYSKEKNTSTKLGYAHVDCLHPEKCSVVFFKPNQPNIPQAAFGNKMRNNTVVETAVRRTQSSLGRPVTDRTAIQTVTFGQSAGKSTRTRAYKATRLFPDEFATFSVRVLIPAKWQGSHTLVAKIERFYVNGKGIDAPKLTPTTTGALPYPPRMETLRAIQSPFRLLGIPSALAEDENIWNPITDSGVDLPGEVENFSQLTDEQIKSDMQDDYKTYDNSQDSSADKLSNIEYFQNIPSKYKPGYVAPAEFGAEFLEFSPGQGTNGVTIKPASYKPSPSGTGEEYTLFDYPDLANQSDYFGDSGTLELEDLFENDLNFDEFALDLDDHDLEIDADMWDNDGETMVTVYLTDDAYTRGDDAPQVVTLKSYIDYEEKPAFTWVYDSKNAREYNNLEVTDTTGWNLDIPLTVLTAGKRPAVLTLEVDGDGYREQAYSNNILQLYLDSGEFQIDRQPEDRTIYVGSNTTFSVEVSGGMKTYDYRWQMKRPGGQWTDLDEGYMRRIELTGVPLEMDGTLFRCIITDSTGSECITREARLRVLRLPLTGDEKPVEMWGMLAICLPCLLAFALFLLLRRRKT